MPTCFLWWYILVLILRYKCHDNTTYFYLLEGKLPIWCDHNKTVSVFLIIFGREIQTSHLCYIWHCNHPQSWYYWILQLVLDHFNFYWTFIQATMFLKLKQVIWVFSFNSLLSLVFITILKDTPFMTLKNSLWYVHCSYSGSVNCIPYLEFTDNAKIQSWCHFTRPK